MPVDTVTTFFALLACIAIGATVAATALAAAHKLTGKPRWATTLHRDLAPYAHWAGFLVAATATAGSLYLSEIALFPPCELCWYQRIAMYPLAAITLIAAVRRDRAAWTYTVPLAAAGFAVSTWHYLLERFPDQISGTCSADVPCEVVWVWKFGFLSIPAMAGAGFAAIIAASLLARDTNRDTNRDTAPKQNTSPDTDTNRDTKLDTNRDTDAGAGAAQP